jgi:uncharacterized protein YggE
VATVTVRGEAVVAGRPDGVTVGLELSAVRASAAEAYDEVAGRTEVLDVLSEELGIAAADRSAVGVTVQPHHEYDGRGNAEQRGYAASNRVLVHVVDHTVVSTLVREAVTRSGARVSGPRWWVSTENPARAEACRDAARDALRKAEAYAEALGRRLGAPLIVREPHTTPFDPSSGTFAAIDAAREIPIAPGDLDVRAAVEITFALEDA